MKEDPATRRYAMKCLGEFHKALALNLGLVQSEDSNLRRQAERAADVLRPVYRRFLKLLKRYQVADAKTKLWNEHADSEGDCKDPAVLAVTYLKRKRDYKTDRIPDRIIAFYLSLPTERSGRRLNVASIETRLRRIAPYVFHVD
jgi:hypothetical protein